MGKILIVEDNEKVRDGLKNIIIDIDANQEIYTTGYSAKAYEIAKEKDIDMFLLDIKLLDYSGIELAREIRLIKKYILTPIIFLTSIPSREILAFKEIHCYDYIIKPFKVGLVKDTISSIIKYGFIKKERLDKIVFKQKRFSVSVLKCEIIYIEYVQRKLKVVTIHDELIFSTYTLSSLQDELHEAFIRCHKGIIINKDYISKVDKKNKCIHLFQNKGILPYGEKYKNELIGEWL